MVNATILNLVHTKKFAVTVASTLSAVAGGATGFLVAKKILTKRYDAMYDEEIADAKAFYKKLNKEDYETPEALVKELELDDEKPNVRPETAMIKEAVTIMESQDYTPYNKPDNIVSEEQVVAVKESIEKNVFAEHGEVVEESVVEVVYSPHDDGGYDLDDELAKQSKGQPYILEKEAFFENEREFSQTTLTWYTGDSVMADDQSDNEMRDWDKVLGIENLQFGRGSQDANIVYIANDNLEISYEVVRSDSKYSIDVLGLLDELEHSDGPRVRKFRRNWD